MKRLVWLLCLIVGVTIWSGCYYKSQWITVDHKSDIVRPTFCFHDRRGKSKHLHGVTKPLYIEEIIVYRVQETEGYNHKEFGLNIPWRGFNGCFWRMQYLPEDKKTTHPVHCIRYGEVPPGYKELVPAKPLELDRVFSVRLYGFGKTAGSDSKWMRFMLRPDSSGAPERLEYVIEAGHFSALDPTVIERQAKEQ